MIALVRNHSNPQRRQEIWDYIGSEKTLRDSLYHALMSKTAKSKSIDELSPREQEMLTREINSVIDLVMQKERNSANQLDNNHLLTTLIITAVEMDEKGKSSSIGH